MSGQTTLGKLHREEHSGAGLWLFVACCLPLIVFFTLVALKVI